MYRYAKIWNIFFLNQILQETFLILFEITSPSAGLKFDISKNVSTIHLKDSFSTSRKKYSENSPKLLFLLCIIYMLW